MWKNGRADDDDDDGEERTQNEEREDKTKEDIEKHTHMQTGAQNILQIKHECRSSATTHYFIHFMHIRGL